MAALSNPGTTYPGKVNFGDDVGIAAGKTLDLTDVTLTGAVALGAVAPTELTIASGAVTRTQFSHKIDTEGDAASDDLDTVTGAATDGVLTLIRPVNDGRTVVVKHGTGNIECEGSEDITLAEDDDAVLLWGNGTKATAVAFKTKAVAGGGLGVALGSTSASKGASLIGVQDSASMITATNVETALAEIALRHTGRAITDPGNGGAIPVTASGVCAIVTAGAETRTLAIPTFVGQRIVLYCDTHAGNPVVTVASPVNVANNNTLTFSEVSEAIELVGVSVGGTRCWQVGWNDGVGLTTV